MTRAEASARPTLDQKSAFFPKADASRWIPVSREQVGGQIAWLLPLAAVGLVLFGVRALVHVAVFSSQKGIFHP
jgi:hypothetical protein